MKVLHCALLCLVIPTILWAGTAGSFRGIVVEPPPKTNPDCIFVQGNNQLVRKVNIASARVVFDDDVPTSVRRRGLPRSLQPGTEVRVTAEQDTSGDWNAMEVAILRLPEAEDFVKKHLAATTPGP